MTAAKQTAAQKAKAAEEAKAAAEAKPTPPDGCVAIKFVKSHAPYNKEDTACFPADEADNLVKAGTAIEIARGPNTEVVEQTEAPSE